jgi:hypothetical protein
MAEPLVPDPSHLEVQIANEKLNKYKAPGSDINSGRTDSSSRPPIHILISSVWNKEEFPDQWKKSVIVRDQKKGDISNCNNYRRISLLTTSYKILSNILPSRLSLYKDKNIGDHQCEFQDKH